jgi:hypothetical protein
MNGVVLLINFIELGSLVEMWQFLGHRGSCLLYKAVTWIPQMGLIFMLDTVAYDGSLLVGWIQLWVLSAGKSFKRISPQNCLLMLLRIPVVLSRMVVLLLHNHVGVMMLNNMSLILRWDLKVARLLEELSCALSSACTVDSLCPPRRTSSSLLLLHHSWALFLLMGSQRACGVHNCRVFRSLLLLSSCVTVARFLILFYRLFTSILYVRRLLHNIW